MRPNQILPTAVIDAPKNKAGDRKGMDISDHYPIIINGLGLKIISYNVQLMPALISKAEGKKDKKGIAQSVKEISGYFAEQGADVCCVQELFDNTANALLEAEMQKIGYVATDRVGKAGLSIFNGGARIFIKKELAHQVTSDECIYKNKIDYLVGADALTNKGVVHNSFINQDGTKTHILNTHLQAFYPGRDHYTEVTLAQCVELKRFVEAQKAKGLIGPDDKIMICGDFNIPKPSNPEEASFLFEKMKRLLGPQFIIADYTLVPGGPTNTLSRKNSYNAHLPPSSDMDVNLDMAIEFDPKLPLSLVDVELADIYCDIQLAMSHYVRKNATLLSGWLLSDAKVQKLKEFNERLHNLMLNADEIKAQNENPLDNAAWFKQALSLLSGPQKNAVKLQDEPVHELQDTSLLELDERQLENIEQCKEKFDRLMHNLKQLHATLHKNYIDDPAQYQTLFATSLKLNHVLLNAGNVFFQNPTPNSLRKFQEVCLTELVSASEDFRQNASFWSKVNPIFKGLLGIVVSLATLPGLMFSEKLSRTISGTFFARPPAKTLATIQTELEQVLTEELPAAKQESPRVSM